MKLMLIISLSLASVNMKPDLNIFLHFHDGKGTEDINTEVGSDYADGNYMNI